MQQSVSVIVNRKRTEYQTDPRMRERYRKIGFRMPAVAYRVTYKLHPYGNLIFIAYPNQPVQLPDTGNYRPSIIVNNRSVCFLPLEWDRKQLTRTVKVL